MAIKVPELKKCCFCVPLRYGLLAWGYIKLAALILLLAFIISYISRNHGLNTNQLFVLAFVITEIIFCVGFIIGAHRINFYLLRTYYYYTLVEIVMAFMGYIIFTLFETSNRAKFQHWHDGYKAMYFTLPIVCLIIEIYIILLLRSKILKLDSNRCFEVVNTEEGRCTLTSEQTGENETKNERQ